MKTRTKITIVPDEQLPYVNWDSPGLKAHHEKTKEILNSPKVKEQLDKILNRKN